MELLKRLNIDELFFLWIQIQRVVESNVTYAIFCWVLYCLNM